MKKITFLAALFAGFAMSAQVTVWEDSFEDYDDFAFEVIGDWTQIDLDGDQTYGIQGIEFPNNYYIGTGIVFNSELTTPSQGGTDYDARTGEKGLYMFASTGNNSGTAVNDDWIITPQIDLTNASGSSLSFWAKSFTGDWGLEKIEVFVSTTGTEVSDFVTLSYGVFEVPEGDYTEYVYDLTPYEGGPIYIAIHYVTEDAFFLQMDDFKVTADALSTNDELFQGFNYYVANNDLNLSANTAMERVSLYNMLGQEVSAKNLSSNNETVSLAGLQSGVYIAKVTIDGADKTFRIVKN